MATWYNDPLNPPIPEGSRLVRRFPELALFDTRDAREVAWKVAVQRASTWTFLGLRAVTDVVCPADGEEPDLGLGLVEHDPIARHAVLWIGELDSQTANRMRSARTARPARPPHLHPMRIRPPRAD
jgi:hypothetical protein